MQLLAWAWLNSLELPVLRFIAEFRHPFLTDAVAAFTEVGSLAFAVLFFAVGYVVYKNRFAINGLVGAVSLSAFVIGLKYLFARPVPPTSVVETTFPYVFPSGHTAVAFFLAAEIGEVYEEHKPFLYVLAGLVGLSRLYLGVHYPSDVIVGGLLGYAVAKAVVP